MIESILAGVWAFLNSPVGVTLVGGGALWLLNKLYARQPLWRQFEGAVISGIKLAEKEIDDNHANKAVARLDAALRYVVRVFEEVNKRRATNAEVIELRDGIQRKHAELEAAGSLATKKAPRGGYGEPITQ